MAKMIKEQDVIAYLRARIKEARLNNNQAMLIYWTQELELWEQKLSSDRKSA